MRGNHGTRTLTGEAKQLGYERLELIGEKGGKQLFTPIEDGYTGLPVYLIWDGNTLEEVAGQKAVFAFMEHLEEWGASDV